MNLGKLINICYELKRGLRGHLAACNSRSLVARCALFVAFIAIPSFAAQTAYDLMERANALYRDGKFKQAITLYRKAESRGADPVATSFNIANSYYQVNDLPNAAATYRKAVDFSNGTFSPALFNMASVYFRLRQYPECVAAYHRALKLEPENVSGWLYLGEAYGKTGDAVGALRAIEKAYQLDKEDISIVYQLSEANIALNDFERAVAVIREGYAAHPEEVDFLVYLGDVYRLNKQFEESAGAYREALGVRPDDAVALADDDEGRADADLEQALALQDAERRGGVFSLQIHAGDRHGFGPQRETVQVNGDVV